MPWDPSTHTHEGPRHGKHSQFAPLKLTMSSILRLPRAVFYHCICYGLSSLQKLKFGQLKDVNIGFKWLQMNIVGGVSFQQRMLRKKNVFSSWWEKIPYNNTNVLSRKFCTFISAWTMVTPSPVCFWQNHLGSLKNAKAGATPCPGT